MSLWSPNRIGKATTDHSGARTNPSEGSSPGWAAMAAWLLGAAGLAAALARVSGPGPRQPQTGVQPELCENAHKDDQGAVHRRSRDAQPANIVTARAAIAAATSAFLEQCDFVRLRVGGALLGSTVQFRIAIVQQKTGRPVPFELADSTREALRLGCDRGVPVKMIGTSRVVTIAVDDAVLLSEQTDL